MIDLVDRKLSGPRLTDSCYSDQGIREISFLRHAKGTPWKRLLRGQNGFIWQLGIHLQQIPGEFTVAPATTWLWNSLNQQSPISIENPAYDLDSRRGQAKSRYRWIAGVIFLKLI